jgi:hypothetical protein
VKALEGALERDGAVLLRMEDQRMIMTVGASEIAVRKKENRADLPGPIDKRRLEKSLDFDHPESAWEPESFSLRSPSGTDAA